jgi:hypothetical protein
MPFFMNLRTVLYSLCYAHPSILYVYFHPSLTPSSFHTAPYMNLHVLAHHGNHEIEQTNSLNESETQNGV